MTKKTVTDNADTIVTSSITETAGGDASDAQTHEDHCWLQTVIASLPGRSSAARQALAKALEDGDDGVGPLLGLASTNTENTQENSSQNEDSNSSVMLSPLLGTSSFQQSETVRESSRRRSHERVCYDKLLRESHPASRPSSQKAPLNAAGDCYDPLLSGVLRQMANTHLIKWQLHHCVIQNIKPKSTPIITRNQLAS